MRAYQHIPPDLAECVAKKLDQQLEKATSANWRLILPFPIPARGTLAIAASGDGRNPA
jgi:hypothetical protein